MSSQQYLSHFETLLLISDTSVNDIQILPLSHKGTGNSRAYWESNWELVVKLGFTGAYIILVFLAQKQIVGTP